MKTTTILFVFFFFSVQAAFSQCGLTKKEIKETNQTVYLTKVKGMGGGYSDIYYYYIMKSDTLFYITGYMERGSYGGGSKSFYIDRQCPLKFIMENGKEIVVFPLAESKSEQDWIQMATSGVIGISAKKIGITYPISSDQLKQFTESCFKEAHLYFKSEKNINSAKKDEDGTYFQLKTMKSYQKKLHKQIGCMMAL